MAGTPLESQRITRLPRYRDERRFLAAKEERGWESPDSYGLLHGSDGTYSLLWNRGSHEICLARFPEGQIIVLAVVEDRSRAKELIAREIELLAGLGTRGTPSATPVDSWLDSVPDWAFVGLGLDPGPGTLRAHASPDHVLYG